MKSRLLLLAISLFALSCNSNDLEAEQETVPNRIEVTAIPSGEPDANQELDYYADQTTPTEYLEWSSVKINNLLSLDTNRRQVEALFGKADSTSTPDYDNICHNCHFCYKEMPAFKEVYFKGIEFEELNDSLIFWSADFSVNKSLFLQSGNVRFDHKTSLEEVAKLFPDAVRRMREDPSTRWVRVSPSQQPVDGDFILEFNKAGYLIMFRYWFPC